MSEFTSPPFNNEIPTGSTIRATSASTTSKPGCSTSASSIDTPAIDAEQQVIEASDSAADSASQCADDFIAKSLKIEASRAFCKTPVVAFLCWFPSAFSGHAAIRQPRSPLSRTRLPLPVTTAGPAVVVRARRPTLAPVEAFDGRDEKEDRDDPQKLRRR